MPLDAAVPDQSEPAFGDYAKLGRTTFYEVHAGDTLAAIAERFDLSQTLIMEVNGLADPRAIFAGLQLQVNGL
jgi:LysM repeat protein